MKFIIKVLLVQNALTDHCIIQQIQEKQAKKLCHEYRSMMKKRIKHGNPQNAKCIIEELTELSVSVADAATGLCRKLLRYKGTPDHLAKV